VTVHQLIGAEVSLYTGKVRAYLRYKRIPFVEVLATGELFRTVIVPRTGVRFIPVLISEDDVAIQDSTAIIDYLEQRYPDPSIYPEGAAQRLAALLLEVYADEWLVIPAMHYRWNVPENRDFAIGEFGRLSAPDEEPSKQREIGEKLSKPFAGALPALGVHPETVPAVEASYSGLLSELQAHFSAQPYLLGTRPSIADFALYGPLYAHLYRDPASGRRMKERAPAVAAWVERLTSPAAPPGSFAPDDVVPATLEPLLRRMFTEQGPVLASTFDRLTAFAREGHAGPLPRSLGRHDFALGGARAQRAIYSFNVWRWQRAHDHYRSLSGAARERADALLQRTGGRELLELTFPKLRRENNQLQLATT
jgi:glutathione S-transferase